MRKKVLITTTALLLIVNIFLIAFAPDTLSMVIIGFMLAVLIAGTVFGVYPMINIAEGLSRAARTLKTSYVVPEASTWETFLETEKLFNNRLLDDVFEDYKKKVVHQKDANQTINNLEEYINEDSLSDRCWHGVISQIPGTLTGLGVLGTFIGLIWGISRIGFNSTEAALESVQTLLSGVHVAFYTSIAGIILSILFNIFHRTIWNIIVRDLNVFIDEFHKIMIPTVEEQERYKEQLHREYVLEKLSRIPKYQEGGSAQSQQSPMHEKILLPQIVHGLENGEFSFLLSAKHDIHSRQVVGYESVLKWSHKKLGAIPASVFMPIVEQNGLIAKINRHIWEDVCKLLSEQNEEGVLTKPIAINVTKTDILADKGDLAQFFRVMADKYNFPPRMLDIEISIDAFTEASDIAVETAEELRNMGFKVIVDNFKGDFPQLDSIDRLPADEIKLSLKDMDVKESVGIIENTYWQANNRSLNMTCEFVKSMEQVKALRDNGCRIAQGSYFSAPTKPEEEASE